MLTIINDTTKHPRRLVIESDNSDELVKECSYRFTVSDKINNTLFSHGFAFIDAIEGNGHAYVLRINKNVILGQL